ncbi:MAG: hypothetical protein NWS31_08905 [Crocinitomicaceae bacterium]|nr:hypothetical protein [Crocinitomicaceae bacterium]
MKNETLLHDFLKSNGFTPIENDSSQFFGDHFDIYSNGEISIRFGSSKALKTIDVAHHLDSNQWFDLALIMALINDEQDLSKVTTVNQFKVFLEKHLLKICELFNAQNYNSTKEKIEVLEHKRVKQMFPGI